MDIPSRNQAQVDTRIKDEKPSLCRGKCDVIQGVGESPGSPDLFQEYAVQNKIMESVSSQELSCIQWNVTIRTATESVTTCAHHGQWMDMALWSGLPEELQELVFAHLPWPQIYQVRMLSKGWNQKLMSSALKASQLKQACVRAQPKSFVVVAPGDGPGSLKVNMFDIASSTWRTFQTFPEYISKWGEVLGVTAVDGGLVCYLTKKRWESRKSPWLAIVCNPLTRVFKQLPPVYGIVQPMIMVKLIMDHETKHYRVIVVGYCKDSKVQNVVKVYHSKTGNWTEAAADSSSEEVVYGHLCNLYSSNLDQPFCSYNFADGLVHEIVTNFPTNNADESDLVNDHLFRVKDVEPAGTGLLAYCIEEYEAMHCGASWTLLKEYPLSCLPRTAQHIQLDDIVYWMHFFACKDYLLLFQVLPELHHEFLLLYEFSTEKWSELPMMPQGGNRLFIVKHQLCELRFDSVP